MSAELVPGAGSLPRRARHLIPMGLPHRGEMIAACAVLIVLAHLLLAQLTLVVAVLCAAITRATRWRLCWLAGPATAGLAWTLAVGPRQAAAGFAAGPARILGYLGSGAVLDRLGRPSGAIAGIGGWLPGQFPLALIAGSAEAAVVGWLSWLHTDEWAVPPPRPGALAAVRRLIAARLIRSGAVLTRDGCALGVVAATGAIAELRWADIADGLLVVGDKDRAVIMTSLQAVHAVLRRRKPLIVIDGHADAGVAGALTAACAATGVPLRRALPSHADLGRAVRERSAALLAVGSPEDMSLAAAAVTELGADLCRAGIDGDGLIWVTGPELIPMPTLAALSRAGCRAGLPMLTGTTSPVTATALAGLVGAVAIHRITDPALAASLAGRTGIRYRPAAVATPHAGGRLDAVRQPPPGPGTPAQPGWPDPDHVLSGADLVPCPAVSAQTILSLGPAEFLLSVPAARRRPVTRGLAIPARLPHPPAGAGGGT